MTRLTPKQLCRCFWDAIVKTIQHDGIEHAGYLAFLTLLALFPFLVFMIAVIGFLGQGEAGAAFINSLLQGLLTISIVGAIWTASSAVEGLRTILNRAYHVATPPAYWLRRSLSILQLLIFTFITVIGMVAVVAVQVFIHHVEDWFGMSLTPENQAYLQNMLLCIFIGVLFIGVSSVYYAIPNIKQRFVSVVPGALLVVIGWLSVAYLFTLYLLNFNQVQILYGSLGGIIAALVFFYVCNMIFTFGAEFNHQLIEALGLQVSQKEDVGNLNSNQ
jgi:membrane protein